MQFLSQLLDHPSLFAYFSGANNYTWLHFRNGERRLLAKPLTYFEERLPAFVRIHKTALINPVFVASVHHPARTKMPGTVRMLDGAELPVSRRRWPDVIGLLKADPENSLLNELPAQQPSTNGHGPYVPPLLVVLAVMTGDALLLTRERINAIGLTCVLRHVELGTEIANALLMKPNQERPALIILDARTNRADRILTLRAFKSHPRLRAIPIVWLTARADDTVQAYALDANSVVVISDAPAAFTWAIEQLCQYWLVVVQLPPEEEASWVS